MLLETAASCRTGQYGTGRPASVCRNPTAASRAGPSALERLIKGGDFVYIPIFLKCMHMRVYVHA